MFEPPPEKPPHFAGHRIAIVGLAGGCVALVMAMWLFGAERVGNSDSALIGTFLVGAVAGVVAGWKLVMPYQPPSDPR
jgi:hypothetical protein